MPVYISLNVQPGAPNPKWELPAELIPELLEKVDDASLRSKQLPLGFDKEGYQGFEILSVDEPKLPKYMLADSGLLMKQPWSGHAHYCSDPKCQVEFEHWLLETGASTLHSELSEHVAESIEEDFALAQRRLTCRYRIARWFRRLYRKTLLSTEFDVAPWRPWRTKDNCYNYAANIHTPTPAQPGKHSGLQILNRKHYTFDRVKQASVADGFEYLGSFEEKTGGHLVALFLWEKTGYHWARFDTIGRRTWSHKNARNLPNDKPGRNLARPQDIEAQQLIRKKYSFAGYFFCPDGNVSIL